MHLKRRKSHFLSQNVCTLTFGVLFFVSRLLLLLILLLLPLFTSCTLLLPLRLFFTYTNACHTGCSSNEKGEESKQETHTVHLHTDTGADECTWAHTHIHKYAMLLFFLFLSSSSFSCSMVMERKKIEKKSNFGSKLSPKQLVTCDFHLLVTFTKYRTSSCIHFSLHCSVLQESTCELVCSHFTLHGLRISTFFSLSPSSSHLLFLITFVTAIYN